MISRPALSTLALTILVLGCAPPAPVEALRYRMDEDPPTLDPFRSGDDNSNVYIYLLFDGLVEFVPGTLDVRPAAAESWTVSPDGLTYTFKLREGARFHNGREVTAQDVVYSIRRALSQSAHSKKDEFLAPLEGKDAFWSGAAKDLPGAVAVDPRTVVLKLSYPYSPFLTVLASEAGSILPPEVYEDPEEGYLRHPVGTGPYRFDSWEPGVSIDLARFDRHWKTPVPGGIQRISFRMIDSATTAMEEYRSGNLDFTQEIPAGQREKVLAEMPEHVHNGPLLSILYIGFNHASSLFKDNALLRRAVAHAIDREFIVRVLQEGKDTLATRIIPPGMLGHNPEAGPAYDPELARRLLAEAGYPGGEGLPELVYRSNDTEGFRLIAERIESDLARVGFKVSIRMTDFGAFLKIMGTDQEEPPDADLFRMTYYADWPDPDNFLGLQFATGAVFNLCRVGLPVFDDLILKARREQDIEIRTGLYRQAETILLEGAHLVPIYWYGRDLLLQPRYKGFRMSPLGTFGIAWEEVASEG